MESFFMWPWSKFLIIFQITHIYIHHTIKTNKKLEFPGLSVDSKKKKINK